MKWILISLISLSVSANTPKIYTSLSADGSVARICQKTMKGLRKQPRFTFMENVNRYGYDSYIEIVEERLRFALDTTNPKKDGLRKEARQVMTSTTPNSLLITAVDKKNADYMMYGYSQLVFFLSIEYAYRQTKKHNLDLFKFAESTQTLLAHQRPTEYSYSFNQFLEISFETSSTSKLPDFLQTALNKYNNPSEGKYEGAVLGGQFELVKQMFSKDREFDHLYDLPKMKQLNHVKLIQVKAVD